VIEWLGLVLSLAAGGGLGLVYFGSLWLTVRRLPTAQHPALLTLGSFVARTAVILIGLYIVMGGRWERLLASLVGFVLARDILIRRWRPRPAHPESGRGEPKN
jgi:F1F0 ATPase subunit 2